MPLPDSVRDLADRILGRLDEARDFYLHTRVAAGRRRGDGRRSDPEIVRSVISLTSIDLLDDLDQRGFALLGAITLAEPREQRQLANIERLTKQQISIEKIPTVADLRARQMQLTLVGLREGPRTVTVYRQDGASRGAATVVETGGTLASFKLLGGGPVPVRAWWRRGALH